MNEWRCLRQWNRFLHLWDWTYFRTFYFGIESSARKFYSLEKDCDRFGVSSLHKPLRKIWAKSVIISPIPTFTHLYQPQPIGLHRNLKINLAVVIITPNDLHRQVKFGRNLWTWSRQPWSPIPTVIGRSFESGILSSWSLAKLSRGVR